MEVKESFLETLLPNGTWGGMRGQLQREVKQKEGIYNSKRNL